jgi:hypothetical protein
MSLEENPEGTGTLGGFFELTLPGSKESKELALTCFHVINPAEKGKTDTAIDQTRSRRKQGIKPGDQMASNLKVYHPSRRGSR